MHLKFLSEAGCRGFAELQGSGSVALAVRWATGTTGSGRPTDVPQRVQDIRAMTCIDGANGGGTAAAFTADAGGNCSTGRNTSNAARFGKLAITPGSRSALQGTHW
jgi:hypothetical protein